MQLRNKINRFAKKHDVELTISTENYSGYNNFYLYDGKVESINLSDLDLINLQDLLPFAATLKTLSLEDCSIKNLNNIEDFQHLESLKISGGILSSEIEKIQFLQKLKSLELINLELKNLEFLNSLILLEFLDISYNNFTEIRGLSNLKKLKKIKINSDKIKTIGDINTINSLEVIDLSYSKFDDYKTIERFQNLKEINFRFSSITKVSNLKLLPNLKKLDLSFTRIDDMVNLGEIPSLIFFEYICPFKTKINDLKRLEGLEYLNLSGDYIYWDLLKPTYIESIAGISELVNLKRLYLSQQNLDKIEDLYQLKSLEKLSLSWNKFSKIDNDCFENLKGLNLSYNNLNSISGNMENMRELILTSNNIRNIESQFLSNIKNECILDIRGNPIKSLSFIPKNIKLKKSDWKKGELIFLSR